MEENQYTGMKFIERLQYFMGKMGINDNQMTVNAGLSVGLIGKAKLSGKGMSSMNIEKILLAYPELSAEWLLTGNGPMLRADERDGGNNKKDEVGATDERSTSDIPIATPATTPGEGIPLLPIDAMAGALTSEQTVLEYECERYVVPIFNGADFLIPVSGNSMTPTYYPGDIVACKRVPLSGLFFQWGKIYVIDTSQGPLIKRIKPGQSPEQLCIVSDNNDYDPFQLPITDVRAVALVVGVIRLE